MNMAAVNGLAADAWLLGTFISMGIRPNGKRAYNRSQGEEAAMPSKFCLNCKTLFKVEPGGSTSRCVECQAGLTAQMNARPKPSAVRRGMGYAHRQRAKAVIQAAQVCAVCDQPPRPGDPLTAHHTTARAKGGQDGPMVAAHRSCNSKIGDRT